MIANRMSWLVVAVVAACGPPPPPAAAPSPATGDPAGAASVTFRMYAEQGTGQRSVRPGETLRTGDRVAMELTVDRPLYGYVLQFFPDGSAGVLFPQDNEDNRLSGTRRVPPSGWFELDEAVGEENVYIVASIRPLEQADRTVLDAVEHVRTTNRPPPDDPATGTTAGEGDDGESSGEVSGDEVDDGENGDGSAADPDDGSAAVATGPDAGEGSAVPPTTRPKARPTTRPHGVGAPRRADDPPPGRSSLRMRGLKRVQDTAVIARTDADGLAIFSISFPHVARP